MSYSDFISAAALAVAILSALLAWKATTGQTKLQKQMLELEQARERDRLAEGTKTTVIAEMTRTRDSGRLHVVNTGPATARNIRVLLDGISLDRHPHIHKGAQSIGVLGPGGRSEFVVATWDGMPPSYHVSVTWENAGAPPGSWESDLSFLI